MNRGGEFLNPCKREFGQNMDNAIETLSSTGWLTIQGLVVLEWLILSQGTWSDENRALQIGKPVILSATSWTSWYFRSDIAGFFESRIQVPKPKLELHLLHSFLISYLVLSNSLLYFYENKDVQGGGMIRNWRSGT